MVNKETKGAIESHSLGCSKTYGQSVPGNCETGIPRAVNYNPLLCRLGQVIRKNPCFYIKMKKFNKHLTVPPLFHFLVRQLLGAT